MPNNAPLFNNFNLADLYQTVWGITPAAIVGRAAMTAQDAAGIQASNALYKSTPSGYHPQPGFIFTESHAPVLATSALGTPIMEQITFEIPTPVTEQVNFSLDGKGPVETITYNQPVDYPLPGWPLFDITGTNVIEKTPNRGSIGTVKEYIYQDDYQITIRGFLINEGTDAYPEQQLRDLLQIINRKITYKVKSLVFTTLGINAIVIDKWSFPSVEGFPNIQPFELNCLSDSGEDIIIQQTKDPTKQQVTK